MFCAVKKPYLLIFANLHNNKRLIPTKISKVLYIFHGSYYITGDERGKKKREKYEWSAGKQI